MPASMPDTHKIETWVPHDNGNGRPLVTTRYATVFEARKARAAVLGVPVTDVCGRRV